MVRKMHYIATALILRQNRVAISILLSPSINVSVRYAVQNLVRNA